MRRAGEVAADSSVLLRRTEAAGLAALLALHAALGACVMAYGTDFQDEGLLYAWGARLLDGQLPYTDFYLVQAPGTFYLSALSIKLFGVSLLAGRAFKQLQGLAVIVLAFMLLRRASGSARAGLVAALAATIFSAAHHVRFPWYSTDACVCLLIAAWLACVAIDSGRSRWLLAAGVMLGSSVLFKQNHGVFGALAIGGTVCHHAWHGNARTDFATRATAALASGGALALGCIAILGAYLTYYVAAGGSAHVLWLNTFVWASEAKDYPSLITTATTPLSSFTLTNRGDWRFPAGAVALIAGSALAMTMRVPPWIRGFGVAMILACAALGPDFFVRAFIWSLLGFLVLLAAMLAFHEARATASGQGPGLPLTRAHKLLLVGSLAVANLYGGTIPGGGWGRLVETLSASLPAFGVFAALLETPQGPVGVLWNRFVGTAPSRVGLVFALVATALSAGLLIKNQAFRPKLDVELAAMQARATLPGLRGLRGDPTYVAETEALVAELRGRPAAERSSVYVFPLNAAIVPLAGARNPTRYDSHQVDFLAPSRFPDLLAELERSRPRLVVLQPIDNPSSGSGPGGLLSWVRPPLRAAIEAFVRNNYVRARKWHYYELWQRR